MVTNDERLVSDEGSLILDEEERLRRAIQRICIAWEPVANESHCRTSGECSYVKDVVVNRSRGCALSYHLSLIAIPDRWVKSSRDVSHAFGQN
jgi:hypothetical protein